MCPVMRSLNSPQDYWEVDQVTTELKIHKLQEELERVTLENSRLLERSGVRGGGEREVYKEERIMDKAGQGKEGSDKRRWRE